MSGSRRDGNWRRNSGSGSTASSSSRIERCWSGGRGGETLVELTFTTEGVADIQYVQGNRRFRLGGPAELALMELARESTAVSRILSNFFRDVAATLRR